ncbi:short neuropeptide F [Aethina tumida]|uniref:short neuropeptide F n=1 Tax=Aethina tumida TaxID=116153 RepID=UPI00096B31CE|nr:short neuropeptide F [Aethina tumida]
MQSVTMKKYLLAVVCIAVLAATISSAAPSYSDYDNNIRDLFEILMQRDGVEDGRLGLHQVVRKQSRSPQLRLRFGKRQDPSLLPVSAYMMGEQDN